MSVTVNTTSTAANYIGGRKLPDERDDFGTYCSDLLRWCRTEQGLSVAELAKRAGVSRMFIIRAEKYKWQSIKKMMRVLYELGLNPGIGFELESKPNKEVL